MPRLSSAVCKSLPTCHLLLYIKLGLIDPPVILVQTIKKETFLKPEDSIKSLQALGLLFARNELQWKM